MKCNDHLAKIGSICCQKIIPLVFDQSYSYYEQLCAFATKLNEIICAVNEQNLTIADFENRINTAFQQYKSEMNLAFADFQIEVNQKIDEFTTEIRDEWRIYRETLNLEFTELKNANQQFKTDMQTAWSTYQAQINSTISNFMTAETTARTNFETAQTQRQTDFEAAQSTRQTNYENNLTSEWENFESGIENTIDGEINTKVKYYESPFGALSGLQSDPPTIPSIASAAFDFSSNIVRVYTFNRITGYDLIKRCRFGDLSTDQDIPAATKDNPILIIFENPAVAEYFKAGITMYGSRNSDTVSGASVVVRNFPEIAKTTSLVASTQLAIYTAANDTPGVPQPMTPTNESYPATPSYNYIGLQFFAVNYDISITQPTGATTKVFPGFVYDGFSGGIIRDPELVNLLDNIIPFALQRGEYTLNDQSELTFDTLSESKYYRYTASAIGNPVSGGYGIIVNIRFTAYAVQLLFSQTTATAPTQLLYRLGTDMSTAPNWKPWRTLGAKTSVLWSSSDGAVTDTEYTLTDSINNYDAIYLKIGTDTDISDRQAYDYTSFLTAMYTTGEEVAWEGFFQRYLRVIFNANKFTQTKSDAMNEELGYHPKVRAIVGVKY